MPKEYRFIYAEQLKGKRHFNSYLATDQNPLSTPENLILSFMIHKDKYKQPGTREICRWTGVADRTVTTAVSVICTHHGLFGMTGDYPPKDWFFQNKTQSAEFHKAIKHFTYYTPSESGPLSVNDSLVWSWMYAEYAQHRSQFAANYIATCLNLNPRTVQSSIDRLQELKFLKANAERMSFVSKLTGLQQSYFASKGTERIVDTFDVEDEPAVLNDKPEPVKLHTNTEVATNDNEENYIDFINFAKESLEGNKLWYNKYEAVFRKRYSGKHTPRVEWGSVLHEFEELCNPLGSTV